MDTKNKNVKNLDPRIAFYSYQTQDGATEVYPAGSFTFEYFLYFNFEFNWVYTNTSNTPNTFFTELSETKLFDVCKASTTSRAGQTSGFNFYESTLWKFKKQQTNRLPLMFLTHTVNYVNNVRWVFLTKITSNSVKSTSRVYPAATWSEREVQDMFDVSFVDLKDTRRLLLEYKTPKGVLNAGYQVKGIPKYSTYYDVYYV